MSWGMCEDHFFLELCLMYLSLEAARGWAPSLAQRALFMYLGARGFPTVAPCGVGVSPFLRWISTRLSRLGLRSGLRSLHRREQLRFDGIAVSLRRAALGGDPLEGEKSC